MDPTLIPSDGSAAERPEETGGGLALDPDAELSAVRCRRRQPPGPGDRRLAGQVPPEETTPGGIGNSSSIIRTGHSPDCPAISARSVSNRRIGSFAV